MKGANAKSEGVPSGLFDVALKVRPGAFADNAALLLGLVKDTATAGGAEVVVPADFIRGGDCGSLNDHPAFQAALAAAQEKLAESDLTLTVTDRQYSEQFAGNMFINPKAKSRPGIVDKHGARIIDAEEIYSGCWVVAALSFFPYDMNGNRGVGVGIDNVMKLADGESLAGKPSAESDFAGYTDEDDDDDDL